MVIIYFNLENLHFFFIHKNSLNRLKSVIKFVNLNIQRCAKINWGKNEQSKLLSTTEIGWGKQCYENWKNLKRKEIIKIVRCHEQGQNLWRKWQNYEKVRFQVGV